MRMFWRQTSQYRRLLGVRMCRLNVVFDLGELTLSPDRLLRNSTLKGPESDESPECMHGE